MRFSRRCLFRQAGNVLALLGLAGLLQDEGLLAPVSADDQIAGRNPLAARPAHFAAKAKSVVWLFMNGGPSQVDTWDHKPELNRRDRQELAGFDLNTGFRPDLAGPLLGTPFKFSQHGECGRWGSELFPHMAQHVDKMGFIHSCRTESNNHSPALYMINTGQPRMGWPCVGSWVTYGLGSENQDLPGFVVMSDPLGRGLPRGRANNWNAGFLPSAFQDTHLRSKGEPILDTTRAAFLSQAQQRRQLDLLAALNREHRTASPDQIDLDARIESFELAYRMQSAAPEAFDLSRESRSIQSLYGLHNRICAPFAGQCLRARRLIERGVRFVQIYSGGTENQQSWDGHKDIFGNHRGFAAETDQPVAALLSDLSQRGLLDETLVIWGGEFGRLPVTQMSDSPGRDHNPHAFTIWMAGGGVKAGTSYGETDEMGLKTVVNPVSIHDLHATILHLLGLYHETLTYRFNGRDFRLTDVSGSVIDEILA